MDQGPTPQSDDGIETAKCLAGPVYPVPPPLAVSALGPRGSLGKGSTHNLPNHIKITAKLKKPISENCPYTPGKDTKVFFQF